MNSQIAQAQRSPEQIAFDRLPKGDSKIICLQPRGYRRAVDKRIWAKLGGEARARWIETIRIETDAMRTA